MIAEVGASRKRAAASGASWGQILPQRSICPRIPLVDGIIHAEVGRELGWWCAKRVGDWPSIRTGASKSSGTRRKRGAYGHDADHRVEIHDVLIRSVQISLLVISGSRN